MNKRLLKRAFQQEYRKTRLDHFYHCACHRVPHLCVLFRHSRCARDRR